MAATPKSHRGTKTADDIVRRYCKDIRIPVDARMPLVDFDGVRRMPRIPECMGNGLGAAEQVKDL